MNNKWSKSIQVCVVSCFVFLYSMSGFAHRVHHEENHKKSTESINTTHYDKNQFSDSKGIDSLITAYSLSGDDALIEKGWALLNSLIESEKPSIRLLLQAAWLSQAEHKFETALNYVNQVLKKDVKNAQAWLLKSSIHLVQGSLDQARFACQQLGVDMSVLVALTCSARLSETSVQKKQYLMRLIHLMKLYESGHEPRIQAWADSVVADLAKDVGGYEVADLFYQRSIEALPTVQVRAAYADLLLKQEKYHKVVYLINHSDSAPALAIRRLIAEKAIGRDIQKRIIDIDKLFRSWFAENDFRHAREMAIFYLKLENDPVFAYYLAKENVKIQREPEDKAILFETQKAATLFVSSESPNAGSLNTMLQRYSKVQNNE